MISLFATLQYLKTFAASCANYNPSFFEFPTWYKYLIVNGKIEDDCSLSDNFGLMDIWSIVIAVIEMIVYVAGIVAVVMIIWGGFRMITSQGSPETIKEARNTVLYAVIGLVVTISARAIMGVVGGIFS